MLNKLLILVLLAFLCLTPSVWPPHNASVTLDETEVLFVGIDQGITVTAPGYEPNELKIVAEALTCYGSRGAYVIKPIYNDTFRPREARIGVYGIKPGKQEVLLCDQPYRILKLPPPQISLGTKTGGHFSRVELSAQNVLIALFPSFKYGGLKQNVKRFHFTFIPKDRKKDVYSSDIAGQVLPDEIRSFVKSSNSGDIIIFSDIDVEGPSGMVKVEQGPVFFVE